jgi:DNA-directed RNA polymerase specialized sigma24 family protein
MRVRAEAGEIGDRGGGPVGVQERWSPERVQELRDLYQPLRRFAAVIGRFDVDPDDLVQEALAKVLQRDPAEIVDLGSYVRRIIANAATDERRRVTRANGAFRRLGAGSGSPDHYPSDLDDLMRLQPTVRALLYLVEIEGQPVADAAALVGMSHSGARVALMRARRRLRGDLATEANDG